MKLRFNRVILSLVLVFVMISCEHQLSIKRNETAGYGRSPKQHGKLEVKKVKFIHGHWGDEYENLLYYERTEREVDMEQAVLFENAVVKSIKVVQTSLRVVSTLIRISADTAAGVVSGLVKGVGGVFTLLASLMRQMGIHMHHNYNDSHFLHGFGHKFSRALNSSALLAKGLGDSCIWGGEIAEAVTTGLGEALQDSFYSLEVLSHYAYILLRLILPIERTHIATDANDHPHAGSAETANVSREAYESALSLQNLMYHSSHYAQEMIPVADQDGELETEEAHPPLRKFSGDGSARPFNIPASKLGKATIDVKSRFREADLSSGGTHNCGEGEDGCKSADTDWFSALSSAIDDGRARLMVLWGALCERVDIVVNVPIRNHPDVPSMGPYVLLGLLVVSVVNLLDYVSLRRRLVALLLAITLVWMHLVSVEHSQRVRLVQRVSAKSLHSYLNQPSAAGSNSQTKLNGSTVAHFESAAWLNAAVKAMWSVDERGGLGPYLSAAYEDLVRAELAKVPPAVANVRLKKLDLGSAPPLVKSVRVLSHRDAECFAAVAERYAASSKKWREKTEKGGDDRHNMFGWLHDLVKRPHSEDESRPLPLRHLDQLLGFLFRENGDAYASRRPAEQPNNISEQRLRRKAFSECDSVTAQVDFVYASQHMDIEVSLRSGDSRSMLPDVSATLSEVLLAGRLSLDMRLTSDYPFIGNATMSFLEQPSLDFTVSSLGGLELSAIPLAFYWMNTSLHWAVAQYTAPLSATVDLRHTICPDCDAQQPLSMMELLRGTVRRSWSSCVDLAENIQSLQGVSKELSSALGVSLEMGRRLVRRAVIVSTRMYDDFLVRAERWKLLQRLHRLGQTGLLRVGRVNRSISSAVGVNGEPKPAAATERPAMSVASRVPQLKAWCDAVGAKAIVAARGVAADLAITATDLELLL